MSQLKYLTNDLDELEAAEHDLEDNGVPRSHIHVLGNNEAQLQAHDLPLFSEWSKRDMLYYGLRGALVGGILASTAILGAYIYGVSDPGAWLVIAFVSTLIVGFFTWEGGLVGINKLNHSLEKYREAVNKGEYLLVIDPNSNDEEKIARYAVSSHPVLRAVD